jgi:hypothetical protein
MLFTLMIVFQLKAQSSSVITIDNFDSQTVGASLSKFSLWSNCNATVTYTASTDKFGGSKSAKVNVASCDDGGWITNTYNVYASSRDWSAFIGFRVKIQTSRNLNLSFTMTDKSSEPWVLNPSGGKAFTKDKNDSDFHVNSSKGQIELPKGFEGEILIPFSSFVLASWYNGVKNNIFETSEIKTVQFGFSSTGSANTALFIDDISVYDAAITPVKVQVTGIEKGYVPTNKPEYISLTANLLNDLNLPIELSTEGQSLIWQVTPSGQGVDINENLLTIKSTAIEALYTVRATFVDNQNLFGEKQINISPKSPYVQSLYSRLNNRTFPTLHQAWNGIDDGSVVRGSVDDKAKHDLFWHNPSVFSMVWQKINGYEGFSNSFSTNSINTAKIQRQLILQKNPNMLLFGCVTWIEKDLTYLPDNHEWWLRDGNGNKIKGWGEGTYQSYLLDTSNDSYQDTVVTKAKAIANCGVFDGIMIDCWKDTPDYVKLLQKIRVALGDEIMIIVNSNMFEIPNSAQYVNGLFMESYQASSEADWRQLENTLVWAEHSLRMPRVNCLETWAETSRTSSNDLRKMRATTTLSLTRSNGYCLFADDNALPVGDHLHNFYDFWVKRLGRVKNEGELRTDRAYEREFENGTVVYNPIGNQTVVVTFDNLYKSISTGITSTTHTLSPYDGDIYINLSETSVNEFQETDDIKVFPNPAKNHVTITTKNYEQLDVNLFSLTGQLLRNNNGAGNIVLKLNDLEPNLYLLEIKNITKGSFYNIKINHIK